MVTMVGRANDEKEMNEWMAALEKAKEEGLVPSNVVCAHRWLLARERECVCIEKDSNQASKGASCTAWPTR